MSYIRLLLATKVTLSNVLFFLSCLFLSQTFVLVDPIQVLDC